MFTYTGRARAKLVTPSQFQPRLDGGPIERQEIPFDWDALANEAVELGLQQ
jgi:hypothetical protein